MKRILMVNYEFPPLGGGGGVAAFALAKELVSKGHSVDYLTTWHRSLPKFEIVDGIRVFRVKVIGRDSLETASLLSMCSFLLSGFFRGVALCRENKYDLLNTHFAVPSGPLGFILSKFFSIKNMLFIHGGDIYDPSKRMSPHRNPILRSAIRFILNHTDAVIAQSNNTKENCIKYYHPQGNIAVLPLMYEPKNFASISRAELGLQDDKKYIIGIGRLIKRKDFESFIRTIAKLDGAIEGIIIGEGPERAKLEKLAAALNISKRMHFAGSVSEEKKFQYLSNADAYLLSSLHEGYGIVLQEAMQAGLPIVATNNGGQTDLVMEGKNGYLVNVGDVDAIAEKISHIVGQPDLRRIFAEYDKEEMRKFAPDAIYKKYIDLVNNI